MVAAGTGRRELLVSKGWVQAVALTFVVGFFLLGLIGYRTYSGQPPIPERAVDPAGDVVVTGEDLHDGRRGGVGGPGGSVGFTGEDIKDGQKVFLKNGLMQYGSVFGHGGYLGPDYTADYLRRAALAVRERYEGEGSDRAAAQTVRDFRENRYDPETEELRFTGAQAAAFGEVRDYYGRFFGEPSTKYGLRPEAITDPGEIKDLTALFGWSARAAAAERPRADE